MAYAKSCTKCGKIKDREMYHRDRTAHDGLSTQCKKCRLKVLAKSRIKHRAKSNIQYLFDMETLRANIIEELSSELIQYEGKMRETLAYNNNVMNQKIDNVFLEHDKKIAEINTCNHEVYTSLNTISREEQIIIFATLVLGFIGLLHIISWAIELFF